MMTTLHSLAKVLSEALIKDTRLNGDEFYLLKKDSPQWMLDVIYVVHSETAPDDTIYRFISKCASALAESDEEDELSDVIDGIEPDFETYFLTGWLHAHNNHMGYLTEALEKLGEFKNGFELLVEAQRLQIQEIGYNLAHELEKKVMADAL